MLVGCDSPGMTMLRLAIVTRSVPSSAIAFVGSSIVWTVLVERT